MARQVTPSGYEIEAMAVGRMLFVNGVGMDQSFKVRIELLSPEVASAVARSQGAQAARVV